MTSPVAAVTVVMPVFDPAPGFRERLAQVVAVLDRPVPVDVLVVDDGSPTPLAPMLADLPVAVVTLPRNSGRAAARNAGAAAAGGDALVFIDADCVPSPGLVAAHRDALDAGADLSVGVVRPLGEGFWARYQGRVAARRAADGARDPFPAFTSQNFAIRRETFRAVGGFDEAYRRYGFEDRDLAARVLDAGGRARMTAAAAVGHVADLTLVEVARKLREAGATTGARFASRHPARYATMPYARVDAARRPVLRLVARAYRPWFDASVRALAPTVDRGTLPDALSMPLVRAVSALAYLVGSASRAPGADGP